MELAFKTYLLIICVINGINGQEKTHYIGTVVDFAAKFDKSVTPVIRITANLKEYEKLISDAGEHKADIIVFPECGLTSIHLPTTKSAIFPYSSVIPDPAQGSYNPCEDSEISKWSLHIRRLSCAARASNIYVVVNLPERYVNSSSRENDTDLIYNTNIVFDRRGNLIARYRKFNLFVEPGFSKTDTVELIKFKTDFGVTFGTFTCFDIMFKTPALDLLSKNEDVTDIVYPTAWFSELPFLTAVQTQAGWAKANGVNLLAAGYNNPQNKNGGSGIYTADGGLAYIMPWKNDTSVITAYQIPIIKKRQVSAVTQHKPTPSNIVLDGLVTQEENFSNYTTQLLNESLVNYTFCHKDFCCNFDVTFNKNENADYYYRLVVYEGVRLFGVIWQDVQICGVAACTNETVDSCGKRNPLNRTSPIIFDSISVKGDKFIKNSTFFPSYVDYHLGTTSHYYYNVTDAVNKFKMIEMKNLVAVKDLLGFGIYGTVTFSAANSLGNELFLMIIVACFVLKFNY